MRPDMGTLAYMLALQFFSNSAAWRDVFFFFPQRVCRL